MRLGDTSLIYVETSDFIDYVTVLYTQVLFFSQYGCYQSVQPPPQQQLSYTQLAPSPLTPTPPPTPDCGLVSQMSSNADMDLARRSLHMSPIAGIPTYPMDYGVENMLMDPRWTTLGQYLGDAQDMCMELERRAQLQLGNIILLINNNLN